MPYTKQAIIKYKKTTLSIKYYLLEEYGVQLFNDGDNYRRRDYYAENKKIINKKIRTELDNKNIDKNLSQYVEHWLYWKIKESIMSDWMRCEERNKSQRESLNKKYSIVKIDELLEKIDCLERKVFFLEDTEELEKYFKEKNQNKDFILKDFIEERLDC